MRASHTVICPYHQPCGGHIAASEAHSVPVACPDCAPAVYERLVELGGRGSDHHALYGAVMMRAFQRQTEIICTSS